MPPLLKGPLALLPPQTIISSPVQTAVWEDRPAGAPAGLTVTQLSVPGAYLPPRPPPPQTIISVPVHTAVCLLCCPGAPVVLTAFQVSVPGVYLAPLPSSLWL